MIRHLGRIRIFVYSLLRFRTLGSSLIAVDDQGRVVMVRNSYSPDKWRLPGGALQKRESFPSAALREAREEVGISLERQAPGSSFEFFGLYLHLVGNWQNHIALYVMKGWTQVDVDTWEVAETARFHPDELPDNVAPAHRRRIEEWAHGRPPDEVW